MNKKMCKNIWKYINKKKGGGGGGVEMGYQIGT